MLRPPESNMDMPEVAILSNGNELDVRGSVVSVRVMKSLKKIPEAELVILDGSPVDGKFELSDGSDFDPGKEIEIKAGYQQQYKTIFKGIVVKHMVKSSATLHSRIHITIKNQSFKLAAGRKSKIYTDKTDSDIIEELIKGGGAKGEVDSTTTSHAQMIQYNCSDWDFINLRAEANGMMVIPGDKVVAVKKISTSGPDALEVIYGDNILSVEAEIDGRNSFEEFAGESWSYADMAMSEATPDIAGLTELGKLSSSTIASDLKLSKYEKRVGARLPDNELKGRLNTAKAIGALAKIRGRVKVMGVAGIEPGDMISLDKLGKKFSGKALVSGIMQEIAPGKWHTNIQFGLDATPYADMYPDINEKPASGLLGGVNGLQIGIVSQIDSDPDGENRILVKLPSANAAEDAVWARVATLDAGNERGSFFLPEVDDEVVLGFINDDPRDAIVLGMLNSSSLPAPLTADAANPEKGFVTREKIKLIFNDETKTVTIETPGGNTILVDDENKTILIQDQNDNKIEMNDSGIVLETQKDLQIKATGDIKLEGNNIELVAMANFSAEGSAGVTVESSAITEVKGSLIKLN